MKKLKPILLLVLVFGVGAVCGSVATRVAIHRAVRNAVQEPDKLWTRVEDRLARELELTTEQRAEAREILVATREQLEELRDETQPRYAAILKQARSDLDAILSPDQRRHLDELRARRPLLRLLEKPKSGPEAR